MVAGAYHGHEEKERKMKRARPNKQIDDSKSSVFKVQCF